ncbi:hypothetical protein [Pseudodesulfovibrio sediminis]|uniref:Lipoprotein n=1 Tax=Pseudodesulfovibrio sediminis TaxID=2810563 RepID=A0ABN6ET79_9BACT|nr:hypothetical protein [Pseudodesulfovibrio sediminis]BCS88444.1 hypothetical protein PSDVSF_16860 [Pseudodesulfovibrio sediminis]
MIRTLLLIIVLCTAACATTVEPVLQPCQPAIELPQQWFNSGKTVRLRHAGAITIGDTVIPINGFMELDTRHHTAKVVILTGFGIKLASLKVGPDSAQVLGTSPIADQIPHFMDQCILSIRRMFLADFYQAEDRCAYTDGYLEFTGPRRNGVLRSVVDQHPGFVRKKIFESTEENWTVNYGDAVVVDDVRLPGQTSFVSNDKKYSVTLKLKTPDMP